MEKLVVELREGGVERTLVVCAPHLPALAAAARAAGAVTFVLPAQTADMCATVQAGLDWVAATWQPDQNDLWFLVPADHPHLSAAVYHTLLAAGRADANGSAWVPVYAGRRGHPLLLRWRHAAEIRKLAAGLGVNSYVRGLGDELVEVEVPCDSVLQDLDTPEDYRRLQRGT